MGPEGGRRVGVLGGTFDPPHLGHVAVAEAARDELELDSVLLVPANVPPHKTRAPRATAEQRFEMTELACRGRRGLAASDLEIRRAGTSYTADTLRELAGSLGPGGRLWLLLGADSWLDLPNWREPKAILEIAEPVVVRREGFDLSDARAVEGRAPRILPLAEVPIASTRVRELLASGASADDLLPEPVAAYIREHGLYRARALNGAPAFGETKGS